MTSRSITSTIGLVDDTVSRRRKHRANDYGSKMMVLEPADAWRLDAPCRDLSIEDSDRLFFSRYNDPRSANLREAMIYCNTCPTAVKAACLKVGMKQEYGIFGGTTPLQRDVIRGHKIYPTANASQLPD